MIFPYSLVGSSKIIRSHEKCAQRCDAPRQAIRRKQATVEIPGCIDSIVVPTVITLALVVAGRFRANMQILKRLVGPGLPSMW